MLFRIVSRPRKRVCLWVAVWIGLGVLYSNTVYAAEDQPDVSPGKIANTLSNCASLNWDWQISLFTECRHQI